uniref:Fusaric acid resistance protein conserved region n=1 Tax=Caulobacter sp. (strain K31) TaxID=366602 RepID=B0SXE3_CAUSK
MPEAAPSDWRRFVGLEFSRAALARAATRKTELRHAVRVSAAVGAAYAVASLLRLPQGYWAVFTAVIVVQSSLGATITASIERFMGTVVGALAGAGAAMLHARWPEAGGPILVVTAALLAFLAAVRPAFKVAPVTAVIMLIGTTTHMDPLVAAFLRTAEITVGSVVGIAATLLIFPARAHASVVASTEQVAGLLADLLEHYALKLKGGATELEARDHYDDTLKALSKLQTAMTEADRESASKLSDHSVTDALPRTLWRLRNDCVMIGRALREAFPSPGLTLQSAAMLNASAVFLRTSAALLSGGPRPDRITFAQAHQAFQAAVEALRAGGGTRALAFDDAARVFGLVFAVENLFGNLGDFEERVEETVGKRG